MKIDGFFIILYEYASDKFVFTAEIWEPKRSGPVAGSYVEAAAWHRTPVTIVHLVRHGDHDEVGRILSGRSAIGLNEAGRAAAARLAGRLAAAHDAAIFSSPLLRALETATILAAPRGATVATVDALDEIDFGRWTGLSFAALDGNAAWRRWNAERGRASPPGGETIAAVVERVRGFLDTLDGTVAEAICVSHCDVIRAIVCACLGLTYDRMLGFDCDPASVTSIALYGGGGRILSLNGRGG